jgi:hypothetical protein
MIITSENTTYPSYDRDFNDAHVYRCSLLQKILHTPAMIGTLMMPMYFPQNVRIIFVYT